MKHLIKRVTWPLILTLFLVCSSMTIAYSQHNLLHHPFDNHAYQRCRDALQRCHNTDNPQLDPKCVNQIALQPSCKQLNAIATATDFTIATTKVTALSSSPLKLITNTYTADGGLSYQLLTPHGKLLSLQVKNELPGLKPLLKQFPNALLVPNGAPHLNANTPSSGYTVAVPIKALNGCMACKTLATIVASIHCSLQGTCNNTLTINTIHQESR